MIHEDLCVLQSDIDDDTAENLAAFLELVLDKGANDCVLIPIIMKKNRPGVRLEILCPPEKADFFGEMILEHTTSVGYRQQNVSRHCLERRVITIEFDGVEIRVKVVMNENKIVRWKPEHEDCQKASSVLKQPLRDIKIRAHEIARNQLFDKP